MFGSKVVFGSRVAPLARPPPLVRSPSVPVSPFHPHHRRKRAFGALAVLVLMLVTLGAAFFRTQVLQYSMFTLRSDDNRFRSQPIPAPRGTVRDRNGEIIAETVTAYTLSLEPAPADTLRARLGALVPLLRLDSATVAGALEQIGDEPDDAVAIVEALSFEQLSRLEENRAGLHGVLLEARPVRRYPSGEATAHVVGYVGEISEREMENPRWEGYRLGQRIGKAGVEREYERVLGGAPGARYVETDARGRVVGGFASQLSVQPTPGTDLRLTLDLSLQRFAHAIFPRDMRGAIVAMVPSTGEILALYSHPTYDPNLLLGRISPALWKGLIEDPGRPLLNRATDGIYPPGSTWKLATAMIALERGAITPQTRMPIPCTGGMSYAGRYSRCWKRDGHGSLDLAGAIANSCNVYFYQLGIRLGLDLLTREGTRLGFARATGLDLPGEEAGTFPDGRGWYQKRFGWKPPPSEVMNLAIGQGPNSQTPMRMAQFMSALAGNGTAPVPHLVARRDAGAPETDLRASPATLAAVRAGMAAVTGEGGTAHAAALHRWKLSGKTGTSQNTQDLKRPHAWFTGFAGPPGGPPEIAIAVVVEFGESGSGAAAPLASRVAGFYLNRKHGFPTEPIEQAAPAPAPATPRRAPPPRRAVPRAAPLPELKIQQSVVLGVPAASAPEDRG